MDFNQEWSFHLGELLDGHLMCGSEAEFKAVTIPHDYSIEQPYDKEQGDGCTGYLLGGMGWYRKAFCATPEMKSGKVFLCFDGIYNRANIYLNEQFIAFHPYGYSPLLLDITEYLQDDNLLAVQVDHTRYADSRWYTGSGIYRKVSLHTCPKTYLPVWGTKVSTVDVSAAKATVNIAVDCKNEAAAMVTDAQLTTKIYAPDGTFVAEQSTQFAPIAPNEQVMMAQAFAIETPVLWGIYEGNLYQVHIALTIGGVCVQEKQVAFGIRDFRFDPDEGFFLNGKSEKIKGVCLHHDAGLVGAAVPKDVWRKRLQTLIEGGCNAIRTAHNPASEDFLDLCDTLGLLVQEEFYDEWDNPKDKR